MMLRVSKPFLCIIMSFAVGLVLLPVCARADSFRRHFHWSGYRWQVRKTTRPSPPGPNVFGNTRANVRVQTGKVLRLGIAKGKSVEIVGPPTGYGRYRWIVKSNLSLADPWTVAAFFARGTRGERDIEFSRWGSPDEKPGSWVTWRDDVRQSFSLFPVLSGGPYKIIIDWKVGATRFFMSNPIGTIVDITVPSTGGGRRIAPRLSYWGFAGTATRLSPYTARSVHPPILVSSFKFTRRTR